MKTFSIQELKALSYRDLQIKAKLFGLSATGKSSLLISRILEFQEKKTGLEEETLEPTTGLEPASLLELASLVSPCGLCSFEFPVFAVGVLRGLDVYLNPVTTNSPCIPLKKRPVLIDSSHVCSTCYQENQELVENSKRMD